MCVSIVACTSEVLAQVRRKISIGTVSSEKEDQWFAESYFPVVWYKWKRLLLSRPYTNAT
jgi:hypothetical protein